MFLRLGSSKYFVIIFGVMALLSAAMWLKIDLDSDRLLTTEGQLVNVDCVPSASENGEVLEFSLKVAGERSAFSYTPFHISCSRMYDQVLPAVNENKVVEIVFHANGRVYGISIEDQVILSVKKEIWRTKRIIRNLFFSTLFAAFVLMVNYKVRA